MIRLLVNGTRAVTAALLLALVFGVGTAQAGTSSGNSIDGSAFVTCGKWILKLRDFGKLKVNDYGSWVPETFQAPIRITPQITFAFGPTTFTMLLTYPDQMGVNVPPVVVTGTYKQKGKKLKFRPDAAGLASLAAVFSDFSENTLFGDPDRQLVVDIPFEEITNANDMRFKGRLKNGGKALKVKFKAKMNYDIQFVNDSEFPDLFNAEGRFKLRADSRKCPTP